MTQQVLQSLAHAFVRHKGPLCACLWSMWWPRVATLHHVGCTVYPKKYAHGFVVLCFVVVMQSFIMNSHEVFIPIHQGCFAGTGAIVRLPQCQWSKPDGYGKISQCLTTTKHSKAQTVCIFLGIYCTYLSCVHRYVKCIGRLESVNIASTGNWRTMYWSQLKSYSGSENETKWNDQQVMHIDNYYQHIQSYSRGENKNHTDQNNL